MGGPPTNICPLLAIASINCNSSSAAVCIEEHCAFWNFADCGCVVHAIADAIREVASES